MAGKFKIKKGDQVVVITGRDKGKKGEVLKCSGRVTGTGSRRECGQAASPRNTE